MTTAGDGDVEFEATLEELEEIVSKLDREGVGLDEAVALFERGIDRLKRANAWLDSASGRVEELIATATGELETRPLADVDEDDDEDWEYEEDEESA